MRQPPHSHWGSPARRLAVLACLMFVRSTFSSSLDACDDDFEDPVVQSELSASQNIFFLRTTNETSLSELERCAIGSAVWHNPTRRVNLFSNYLSCEYVREHVSPQVRLVRYSSPLAVFEGYPHLQQWYESGIWDMKYRGAHISDGLRLALLHRFGGTYMDTDVMSLQSLDGLINSVGVEDPWMINNAVMAFEKGHTFLVQAMHEFKDAFKAEWWGWNGPRMVTRVWTKYLGMREEDDVLLAPVEEFYPVSWRDWNRFFEPMEANAAGGGAGTVAALFPSTRLVHVWHNMCRDRLVQLRAKGESLDGLLLGELMEASCPNVDLWGTPTSASKAARAKSRGNAKGPAVGGGSGSGSDSGSGSGSSGGGAALAGKEPPGPAGASLIAVGGGASAAQMHEASAKSGFTNTLQLRALSRTATAVEVEKAANLCHLRSKDAAAVDAAGALESRLWGVTGELPLRVISGGTVFSRVSKIGSLPFLEAELRENGQGQQQQQQSVCAVRPSLAVWEEKPLDPPPEGEDDSTSSSSSSSRRLRSRREGAGEMDDSEDVVGGDRISGSKKSSTSSLAASFSSDFFGGVCWTNPCGIRCGSMAINDAYLRVPEGDAWTISFWLNTMSLDVTFRQWPHHTPEIDPASLPTRDLKIPAISVSKDSTPERLMEDAGIGMRSARRYRNDAPQKGAMDVLVLGVEDGHVTAGGVDEEWLRSFTPVSDGRWHHIAITLSPIDADKSRISMTLDAVLHAQLDLPSPPTFLGAVLGSNDGRNAHPLIFVDEVGVWNTALSHSGVTKVRNAQLLAAARQSCLPSMPWLSLPQPAAVDQEKGEEDATGSSATYSSSSSSIISPFSASWPVSVKTPRILVLILSDARPSSAIARQGVRNTWVVLLNTTTVVPAFCLSSTSPAGPTRGTRIALEARHYQDILYVDAPDDYTQLSRKVMLCMREAVEWSKRVGWEVEYIVKTDHDVYLRMDVLAAELGQLSAVSKPDHLYWRGFTYRAVPALRDLRDKNADYSLTFMSFPPYTAGVAYVLSWALLLQITAIPFPHYTLNEDQALGMWVMQIHQSGGEFVEPEHEIRFQQWAVCMPDQIAIHPSDRRLLRLISYNIRAGRPQCQDVRYGDCCLCCKCASAWERISFQCTEKGAYVPEFTPLGDILHLAPAIAAYITSPVALERALQDSFEMGEPCPWDIQGWHGLGYGTVSPAHVRIPAVLASPFSQEMSGSGSGGGFNDPAGDASSKSGGGKAWTSGGFRRGTLPKRASPLGAGGGGGGGLAGAEADALLRGISLICSDPPMTAAKIKSNKEAEKGNNGDTATASSSSKQQEQEEDISLPHLPALACGAWATFVPPPVIVSPHSGLSIPMCTRRFDPASPDSAWISSSNASLVRRARGRPEIEKGALFGVLIPTASCAERHHKATTATKAHSGSSSVMEQNAAADGTGSGANTNEEEAVEEEDGFEVGETEESAAAGGGSSGGAGGVLDFALSAFRGRSSAPRVEYLLVSGMVDTTGLCLLEDLPEATRQRVLDPTSDERSYARYPRYGSFAAYCGLLIDVVHADGAVSVFRSPFARNGNLHLHHDVLHILHDSPIRFARVTIRLPLTGSGRSAETLRALRVFDLSLTTLQHAHSIDEPIFPVERNRIEKVVASQMVSSDVRTSRGATVVQQYGDGGKVNALDTPRAARPAFGRPHLLSVVPGASCPSPSAISRYEGAGWSSFVLLAAVLGILVALLRFCGPFKVFPLSFFSSWASRSKAAGTGGKGGLGLLGSGGLQTSFAGASSSSTSSASQKSRIVLDLCGRLSSIGGCGVVLLSLWQQGPWRCLRACTSRLFNPRGAGLKQV